MVYGGASIGVVSGLAYSIWAFGLITNTAAMYAATAAIYVGLAGLALGRLVTDPAGRRRFSLLLAAGMAAYAILWCVAWFGMRGKFHADFWGAAAGLAAMTAILRRHLGTRADFLPLWAVLILCHGAGYQLGSDLYGIVRGPAGRLLWGAAHGFGFGAGLAYLIVQCLKHPRAGRNETNPSCPPRP